MTVAPVAAPRATARPPRRRTARTGLHVALATVSLLWLVPIAWTLYTSLRPYGDTAARGYVSLPGSLSLDNYVRVWIDADLPRFFGNTLAVAIPTVIAVVLLGAAAAYAVTQFRWRSRLAVLVVLVAANLLPAQAIVTPVFRLFLAVPVPPPFSDNGALYDQYLGLVAVHVAVQVGFCAFVLANYMRLLPAELVDAALVDGASAMRTFRSVVLPACRPALAALAILEFTWVYNDYLWGIVLLRTGDKRPITAALTGLRGEYFTDTNLLAAGAILAALPTLAVFLVLQRRIERGLAIGALGR